MSIEIGPKSGRRGFTLIELSIVMTIVAMFAVAFSFRYLGPWTAATIQNDIERIRALDDFGRRMAVSESKPCFLKLNPEQSTFQLVRSLDHDAMVIRSWKLSKLSRIGLVKTGGGDVSARELLVVFADNGSSQSYAVQVLSDRSERWILFIGQTGQVFELGKENEVDKYFSILH